MLVIMIIFLVVGEEFLLGLVCSQGRLCCVVKMMYWYPTLGRGVPRGGASGIAWYQSISCRSLGRMVDLGHRSLELRLDESTLQSKDWLRARKTRGLECLEV